MSTLLVAGRAHATSFDHAPANVCTGVSSIGCRRLACDRGKTHNPSEETTMLGSEYTNKRQLGDDYEQRGLV